MDKTIINNAYLVAKAKYEKKAFTFQNLWKELIKKLKLDEEEQAQVGQVYASMLQDHRFIFAGNNQWKLREYLTLEQQAELSNALYDFKQEEKEEKKRVAGLSKQEDYGEVFYDEDEQEEYDKHKASELDDIDDEREEQPEAEEENQEEDEDAE